MSKTTNYVNRVNRRQFLSQLAGATVACVPLGCRVAGMAETGRSNGGLVKNITGQVLWDGRRDGFTWFHPRCCMIPSPKGPVALMTMQKITGSDYFHPVHWVRSDDLGKTWSEPLPVPGLGRRTVSDTVQEGVCDVVPDYHPQTETVLAMGHNVWYENGKLMRPQRQRFPVYIIRRPDGSWSKKQILPWDDPCATDIYTCGCAQRVTLTDGKLLIALSCGAKGRGDRVVCSVLCDYDGEKVRIVKVGNKLSKEVKRGLLEPSVACFQGQYYMTIRAEDDHGYVTASKDGLNWQPIQPWCWDDGEAITMSTTQQHWLVHHEKMFLVYTRKAKENINLMRWRAPLYMAAVDDKSLRLLRDSERIVLPIIGDGINEPKQVGLMGNFHINHATAGESWVTVGENMYQMGFCGNCLLSRVQWSRPNKL